VVGGAAIPKFGKPHKKSECQVGKKSDALYVFFAMLRSHHFCFHLPMEFDAKQFALWTVFLCLPTDIFAEK